MFCLKLLNYCSTENKFNYLKAAIHVILLNEVHVFQKYYRVHNHRLRSHHWWKIPPLATLQVKQCKLTT